MLPIIEIIIWYVLLTLFVALVFTIPRFYFLFQEKDQVIIEVSKGVAYVVQAPDNIVVIIKDLDGD